MKIEDPYSIESRVYLVTGASGHLGTSICQFLDAANAKLILNGRNKEKLEALNQTLKGDHYILPFDNMNEKEVDISVDIIKDHYGHVDGILNNANHGVAGNIERISWEQSNDSLEQNVTSPLMLIKKTLPLLRKSSFASIVNMASMYGMVSPDPQIYGDSGMNNPAFYGAAKAGMIQLTRYMACHLASEGIRVNSISPGPFPPPSIKDDNPDFHQDLSEKVPMKRIGSADELGGVVRFLFSDASSYITGVNIPVDGGWTAW